MGLHGQAGQRGYAMVSLLVALAVLSVLMSVAMPTWRQLAKREREEELIFRGNEYARAILRYLNKNKTLPPSVDVLVQGKYLRKKYKDPFSPDGEFLVVAGNMGGPGLPPGVAGQQSPGAPRPTAPGGFQQQGGGQPLGGAQPPVQPLGQPGRQQPGMMGITGVRSKSKDASLRIYRGQNRYDLFPFDFNNVLPLAGGRGPLDGGPLPPGTQPMPGQPGGRPAGSNPPGGNRGRGFGPGSQQPPTPGPPGSGRGINPGGR